MTAREVREANCTKNKVGRPTAPQTWPNCSNHKDGEANCSTDMTIDQLQQHKVGEANCTKNITNCNKHKVGEANCSKNMNNCSNYRWGRLTASRTWASSIRHPIALAAQTITMWSSYCPLMIKL